MEIRPLTPTEQKYTYAQSMQIEGQTGTIGHLRGDFATTGYGFYTTWFDTRPQWKSDEFKADLDTVINALREDKGLLHNRYDMGAFARKYPESAMKGNYCTEYGFRVDTGKHAFLFRCNPTKGDYNFYCYCYVKEWLNQHMEKAEQGIRFMDTQYKELFRIPDGGKIMVTTAWGENGNTPAVLLTNTIRRSVTTCIISVSLPSFCTKTVQFVSRSVKSRRQQKHRNTKTMNDRRNRTMAVNQKAVKVLNKVFEAGFADEKAIASMTMDDILSMQGITVADIALINDLQKSIKSNKVISFLGGGMNE